MFSAAKDKRDNNVYFSRKEVEKTNLPFLSSKRWNKLYIVEEKIYLSKDRCKSLNVPIKPSEEYVAFFYNLDATGIYKYTPLYDRTMYDIDRSNLLEKEVIQPNKNPNF